jgi:serine/threonine protein kinase
MERMGGDLRNLIDHGVRCVGDGRMPYVDGQMPFDYSDTIKMMIDISQGMQDLHSCGLIHRDLKAANILVTPLPLDSHLGEVLIESVELEQDLESFYFYVRIGDYESSDDIVGTGFWRPPEVLQSLKDRTEPVKWSFAGDVYSFGMLCYELLSGRIPFEKHLKDLPESYDVVLSGQRPELPPHVNLKMTELLNSCWQMEPEKRPGWTEIIGSLSKELESHRPPGQGPRFYRRMKVGIPKAENQTTVLASPSSSSASPVSLGMQASSSRMESLPNSEHQTPGSFSSTGLLKMQQRGTGPVKSQALPIIWEEDYKFAEWEKILVWREVFQRHDIPNGKAALKALMPRGVARALEDIAAVEVDAESRFREAGAAWFAAMESWVRLTPAAPEDWEVIQQFFKNFSSNPTILDRFDDGRVEYPVRFIHSWTRIREALGAWGEERPVEFEAWKEACVQNTVTKTWRASCSEILNLQERILEIKISPAGKVESGWKADMDLELLKDFNSLLDRKKSRVFVRVKNLRELFRKLKCPFHFSPLS